MSKGLEVGRRRKWPWCSSSVCFSRTGRVYTTYREGALAGLSVRLFDQHLVDRTWRKVSKVTGKDPLAKMSKGLEVGRRRKWRLARRPSSTPRTAMGRLRALPSVFLINVELAECEERLGNFSGRIRLKKYPRVSKINDGASGVVPAGCFELGACTPRTARGRWRALPSVFLINVELAECEERLGNYCGRIRLKKSLRA